MLDSLPSPDDFAPTEETTDFKLHVALSVAGGSGTGKTYSALRLMAGLTGGEPFMLLDTENLRALHYKADFPMMRHVDFGPIVKGQMVGFPPERWISQIRYAQAKGYRGIVIDSFSHAWEGINGVLELQGQNLDHLTTEAQRKANGRWEVNPDQFNLMSWVEPKRRYRRLVETIIQARMHVILCIRAKPVIQKPDPSDRRKKVNSRDTKLRRDDLPWDIASDRDLIFEMSASMLMVPERPGQPVLLKCPDHFRGLFGGGARASEAIGNGMRLWAESGGQDPGSKALIDQAETVSRQGEAALRAWWKGRSEEERGILSTLKGRLLATAQDEDRNRSDDPWDREEDSGPTEEERARAMEEAEAATRADEEAAR